MSTTATAPTYTGFAQFFYFKRIGSCLRCKGTRVLREMYLDGEEEFPCRYCPTDPSPQPIRSN